MLMLKPGDVREPGNEINSHPVQVLNSEEI